MALVDRSLMHSTYNMRSSHLETEVMEVGGKERKLACRPVSHEVVGTPAHTLRGEVREAVRGGERQTGTDTRHAGGTRLQHTTHNTAMLRIWINGENCVDRLEAAAQS